VFTLPDGLVGELVGDGVSEMSEMGSLVRIGVGRTTLIRWEQTAPLDLSTGKQTTHYIPNVKYSTKKNKTYILLRASNIVPSEQSICLYTPKRGSS